MKRKSQDETVYEEDDIEIPLEGASAEELYSAAIAEQDEIISKEILDKALSICTDDRLKANILKELYILTQSEALLDESISVLEKDDRECSDLIHCYLLKLFAKNEKDDALINNICNYFEKAKDVKDVELFVHVFQQMPKIEEFVVTTIVSLENCLQRVNAQSLLSTIKFVLATKVEMEDKARYDRLKEVLEILKSQNNCGAMKQLGFCYLELSNLEENDDKAGDYFEKAIETWEECIKLYPNECDDIKKELETMEDAFATEL
ncbi:hypothetical protein O9G_002524 [Rozella allomycis CSF55]|uniref:TPR-like protein n=1 Tax=Rozella allomycis (strain CSF55) TaxID=988480 RepID=A0A075AYL6_ROZAC|nr:hypothetical protein O9G_002524 [Rozella allomycis CSF55]|eukprot:EPZ33812.1 hypothetical protein O9G_002524 [Rozella allomycis CSF55]